MSIPELVLALQRAEVDIRLAGDELEVSFPTGQVLPAGLVEELKLHKVELVEWLSGCHRHSNGTSIPRAAVEETYPLSPAQQRLWMIDQFKTGQDAYNMYASCTIKGEIDPTLFAQAWEQVVVRHEILRTRFIEVEGDVRQRVHGRVADEPVNCWVDCRRVPDKHNYIRELIDNLLRTRFKLNK